MPLSRICLIFYCAFNFLSAILCFPFIFFFLKLFLCSMIIFLVLKPYFFNFVFLVPENHDISPTNSLRLYISVAVIEQFANCFNIGRKFLLHLFLLVQKVFSRTFPQCFCGILVMGSKITR